MEAKSSEAASLAALLRLPVLVEGLPGGGSNSPTSPSFPAGPRRALAPALPASGVVYPNDLVRDPIYGMHYRRSRSGLLLRNERRRTPIQQRVLAFLRDHVNHGIPQRYYRVVLGHDVHLSVQAALHMHHFHATQADPFSGALGWWEDVGRVSSHKVTVAWRNFIVDQLVTETSEFGDVKFHRVGTDATAESNAHTALIVDAGLEATGTQVELAADQYRSVATVTADAGETWQEHSIRTQTGAAGGTMVDRSLISPTAPVVATDVVAFTWTITINAEA